MTSDVPERNHLETALDYAQRGYQVFPVYGMNGGHCACPKGERCDRAAKHPITPAGLKAATGDESRVRSWWEGFPSANIGIATGQGSGVVVLDIDGDVGAESIRAAGYELPSTVTARTGGGGWHHFYAVPEEGMANRVGILPKVDVRGDGGYVVAAPSHHASGGFYVWEEGRAPGEVPLASVPDWLLTLLQTGARVATSQASIPESTHSSMEFVLDGVPEGQRDDLLYRYACRLQGFGLSRREAEELVLIAAERCTPPFPPPSAMEKVEQAWKHRATAIPTGTTPRTVSWKELEAQEHEPLRWIMEGLLPEGLTILVGRPKAGKSWLALQMAASVALGRNLVEPDCECEAGEVLVMALEDSERRLQDRMRSILSSSWQVQVERIEKEGKPAIRFRFPFGMSDPPNTAHFTTEWPRIGDGFEEHLSDYLDAHPQTRLVIVDILERVVNRGGGRGANAYQADYASIRPLHEFARSRRIAVVAVHHSRKPTKDLKDGRVDAVSGTYGLTAGVDSIMVLERSGQGEGKLLVTGRDIEEELDYAVVQSPGGMWSIVGQGENVSASGAEQEILDVLAGATGMTPTAVAAHFGERWSVSTVKTMLTRLRKKELVVSDEKGQYRALMMLGETSFGSS